MTKRYDVSSPRARRDSDKPFWHRVGTAFENDKGISIVLDSLPLPDKEGRVSMFLFEAKAKDGGQKESAARQSGRASIKADMDDEIPFAPEFR